MTRGSETGQGCPLPVIKSGACSLISLIVSEREPLAEELEGGVAVPHQLMARGRIMGAAQVAAQPGDEPHGIPEPRGGRQPFF